MKFGLDPINYANGFKAALWGSCIGHLKKSKEAWKTGQGWKVRFFGHLGIAVSQALPIIGQIAALIELRMFRKESSGKGLKGRISTSSSLIQNQPAPSSSSTSPSSSSTSPSSNSTALWPTSVDQMSSTFPFSISANYQSEIYEEKIGELKKDREELRPLLISQLKRIEKLLKDNEQKTFLSTENIEDIEQEKNEIKEYFKESSKKTSYISSKKTSYINDLESSIDKFVKKTYEESSNKEVQKFQEELQKLKDKSIKRGDKILDLELKNSLIERKSVEEIEKRLVLDVQVANEEVIPSLEAVKELLPDGMFKYKVEPLINTISELPAILKKLISKLHQAQDSKGLEDFENVILRIRQSIYEEQVDLLEFLENGLITLLEPNLIQMYQQLIVLGDNAQEIQLLCEQEQLLIFKGNSLRNEIKKEREALSLLILSKDDVRIFENKQYKKCIKDMKEWLIKKRELVKEQEDRLRSFQLLIGRLQQQMKDGAMNIPPP